MARFRENFVFPSLQVHYWRVRLQHNPNLVQFTEKTTRSNMRRRLKVRITRVRRSQSGRAETGQSTREDENNAAIGFPATIANDVATVEMGLQACIDSVLEMYAAEKTKG